MTTHPLMVHGIRTTNRMLITFSGTWYCVPASPTLVKNRVYYPNFLWVLWPPNTYLLCTMCLCAYFGAWGGGRRTLTLTQMPSGGAWGTNPERY